MRKSTIKLTNKEFDYISSKEYPIAKRIIIQKICQQFDQMGIVLQQSIHSESPKLAFEFQDANFKTTKGENYESLPYVVLDYPQIKGSDFVILCRTMFWWGKYISFNVIFKTDEFDLKNCVHEIKNIKYPKLKVYLGKNIWQQNLSDKHFIKVADIPENDLYSLLKKQLYVKLSMKLNFKKSCLIEEFSKTFYQTVLDTLSESDS